MAFLNEPPAGSGNCLFLILDFPALRPLAPVSHCVSLPHCRTVPHCVSLPLTTALPLTVSHCVSPRGSGEEVFPLMGMSEEHKQYMPSRYFQPSTDGGVEGCVTPDQECLAAVRAASVGATSAQFSGEYGFESAFICIFRRIRLRVRLSVFFEESG